MDKPFSAPPVRQDPRRKQGAGPWSRALRAALVAALFALPLAGSVLNFVAVYLDGTPQVPDGLDGAVALAVTPDGRHVYATGRDDDALVVFVRDATAETLTFVEALLDQVGGVFGLDGATAVTVSPDSRHVYATGRDDDALAVFVRDPSDDHLAFVETQENGAGPVLGLDGATAVAVSADGRHVYTAGAISDAVAVFARDPSRDHLTFVEAQVDGVGGIDGLDGAAAVTVDPLGGFVLAAGADDDALVLFARDPGSGRLTYVETLFDSGDVPGDADGLDGAAAVAMDPDRQVVYVAGRDEDAIAVLRFAGGRLTPIQLVRNGLGDVAGLERPVALALRGSRHLVAAGESPGSVVVFRREADGTLSFLEARSVADKTMIHLAGARGLAVSPDDKHLFVAGSTADSVVMLRWDGVFEDGFESGDTRYWPRQQP